jgi:hypothetical protein
MMAATLKLARYASSLTQISVIAATAISPA